MHRPQHTPADYRVLKYPTVAPLADNLGTVDIEILSPGNAGGAWTVSLFGYSVRYVVLDGDGASDVAAGLRSACTVVMAATVTGAGAHVVLARAVPLATFADPCLFDWIRRPQDGLSEVTSASDEVVSGRGETRIGRTMIDVGPPDPVVSPPAVDLGTAENYVILARGGLFGAISSGSVEIITGNMGASPAVEADITGFDLTLDGSGEFSTSPEVAGNVYASDYAAPTPATLAAAVVDMGLAYADAASRVPDVVDLNGGALGGLTLVPGVYKWTTGVTIGDTLTLQGGAGDRWIFQVAGSANLAPGQEVLLSGGALPENVVWQAGGVILADDGSTMRGVLLPNFSVLLGAGATLIGRALSNTDVAMGGGNTVTEP